MNQDAEEIRERCKTTTEISAREDACVTRIEAVDGVVREESAEQTKQDEEEEFGERKTTRKHDPRQPSEQQRIERNDASSFSQLVQTLH